jgi:hypothetical protein
VGQIAQGVVYKFLEFLLPHESLDALALHLLAELVLDESVLREDVVEAEDHVIAVHLLSNLLEV